MRRMVLTHISSTCHPTSQAWTGEQSQSQSQSREWRAQISTTRALSHTPPGTSPILVARITQGTWPDADVGAQI
eukprot:711286-Alexandrium_andersonii.AAC.1